MNAYPFLKINHKQVHRLNYILWYVRLLYQRIKSVHLSYTYEKGNTGCFIILKLLK